MSRVFEMPPMIARSTIVARLWNLRKQLEQGDAMALENALLLYDVCETLGLNTAETESVLGFEATRQVEKWKVTKIMEAVKPEPATAST